MRALPDVKRVVSPYSAAGRDQINASHTVAFANMNFDKVGSTITAPTSQHMVNTARSFDTGS